MPKTIMTVDDSPSMRQLVAFTLHNAGFGVVEAGDGVEALAKAANTPVNLFITDLHMPNMDGLELIRRLRAVAQFKFVPILLLTTDSQPEKKLEGKAAGATGWIVKPFDPVQLMSVVNKVMR
jgi:two-component system chemotaxis response regulator CheY